MTSPIQGPQVALPDLQIDLASASKISGNSAAGSATQTAPDAPALASSGDSTDISALSAVLANAVAVASAQSPIRPPVISTIKAQIAAGTYGPDLSSVAETIVRALRVG